MELAVDPQVPYRMRIMRLLKFHGRRALVSKTDDFLEAAIGKEEQLMSKLVEKYGEEPDPEDYKERITRFYKLYKPEKISTIDTALRKFAGKEDSLVMTLVAMYGPEPQPPTPKHTEIPDTPNKLHPALARSRLIRLLKGYGLHDDIRNIPSWLKAYRGKEALLLQSKQDEIGVEPYPEDMMDRVQRFYRKYAPHKLSEVKNLVEKHKGMEDSLIISLVETYGEEPEPPSPRDDEFPEDDYDPEGDAILLRMRLIRLLKYNNRKDLIPQVAEWIDSCQEGQELELLQSKCDELGPEPEPEDYKPRIERIYKAYAPEKVDTVDKLLASCQGEEDHVIIELVKKYGDEPEPPTPPHEEIVEEEIELDPESEQILLRMRLIRLFKRHGQHELLPQVDRYLAAAKGREAAFIEMMEKTYGPEPPPEPFGQRIQRFYKKYAPEKVSTVPKLLESCEGSEIQLITELVKRYGEEPEPPTPLAGDEVEDESNSILLRMRLIRLLKCYGQHEKIPMVDQWVSQHVGEEEEFLDSMVSIYGKEPMLEKYSSRVERFYERYAPEKLPRVNDLLKSYKGMEDDLIIDLVKQYGPEPEPPTPRHPKDEPSGENGVIQEPLWSTLFINKREAMPAPPCRAGHTMVHIKDLFYCFGGYEENGQRTSDLLTLNISKLTQNWSILVPTAIKSSSSFLTPAARSRHVAFVQDNLMFISGGYDGILYLNDTWAFDVDEKSWNEVQLLTSYSPRCGHTANTFHGCTKCVVFGGNGGIGGKEYFNDLYISEIAGLRRQIWSLCMTGGETPCPRRAHVAEIVAEQLYIFGGETEKKQLLGDVFMIDLHSHVWTTIVVSSPQFPPRSEACSFVLANSIYILCGKVANGFDNEVICYCCCTGTFHDEVVLRGGKPAKRSLAGVAKIDKFVVLYGGERSVHHTYAVASMDCRLLIMAEYRNLRSLYRVQLREHFKTRDHRILDDDYLERFLDTYEGLENEYLHK